LKNTIKYIAFLLVGFIAFSAKAQVSDSTIQILTLEDLYGLVLQNHPLAKQYDLLSEIAKQDLRMARGGFDPKAEIDFNNKIFKDKNYYELWNSYLKVPTWFGAEFKAGYEQNRGTNLSQQADTDSGNGLGYVGLSVPLGPISKGFMMDYRRATLLQAQIGLDLAEADRLKEINKLLLKTAKGYWEWYFYYQQYKLLMNAYGLAVFRFDAVKIRIEQGDLAAIDSVQAKITIQQRMVDLKTANTQWRNATLMLSNYLWTEDGIPLELDQSVVPIQTPLFENTPDLPILLSFAQSNHPEIQKLNFKLAQLDVERRLAAEMLKPEIKLKYNALLKTPVDQQGVNSTTLSENYKFGFDFSVPLFLRKGRGKLGMVKAKQQQTTFKLDFQRQAILNEISSNYNDLINLQEVLVIQEAMVVNYQRMLAGERQLFRNGESTIFYVNVWENKLIESQVKLFSQRHKYAKAMAELLWSAGTIGN
jgi:outer membrane protein TolC